MALTRIAGLDPQFQQDEAGNLYESGTLVATRGAWDMDEENALTVNGQGYGDNARADALRAQGYLPVASIGRLDPSQFNWPALDQQLGLTPVIGPSGERMLSMEDRRKVDEWGYQQGILQDQGGFGDFAIEALKHVGPVMMGAPALLGGVGATTMLGEIAGNLFGSGFGGMGAFGDVATGIDSLADFNGLVPGNYTDLGGILGSGGEIASAVGGGLAPVSDGMALLDPLAEANGLQVGNYGDLGGTLGPQSAGDPFIDAYTPVSGPQGSWTPPAGTGTVASAINNLLGTSMTDADVSTGVKVGTTAAGLLAGSGAAGSDIPPRADTSGLDAARARTRASIAGMFDGQDPRYQGIRDSVLGFQKSNLDQDREEAARKLKFSLLRTGNAGGSLQVDEGSKLNRAYDRGLLDVTNLADQAAQSARSSDASTKLDLLGRVDSGLDQDAATASAAEQMRLAGDRATSQGLGTTLGNVFADAGLMFQTDAARKGLTDARRAFQSMFSTVPGSSGGSYTGISGRA